MGAHVRADGEGVLADTFDTIKTQAIKYEHAGYSASLTVYNIALYLLIAERDVQAVKIDALTHPDPWKRNLCTRVVLLILHEWDMDKVTGERLKKAFNDLNVSPEIRKEAVESLRAIRKVQQQAQKKLGDLRNATIAHRDPDALLQYRAIRNLRTDDVFQLAVKFYEAADRFISLVPQIMLEAGSMKALVTQLLAKARK